LSLRFNALGSVGQIAFRSLKRIFDYSRVRFTENGYLNFFNVRPGNPANDRSPNDLGDSGVGSACRFQPSLGTAVRECRSATV